MSTFPVTLSAAAPAQVQIAWTTTDGTAVSPGDYTASNGTLTIPAGQSSGTIQVQVREDALPESAENFHVDLTSATGATLQADRRGTATITDDDSAADGDDRRCDCDRGAHRRRSMRNFPVTLLQRGAGSTVQIALDDDRRIGDRGVRVTTTAPTGTLTIAGRPVGRHDPGQGRTATSSRRATSENFHVDMTSVSGALFTADRRRHGDDHRRRHGSRRSRSVTSRSNGGQQRRGQRELPGHAAGQRPVRPCRSRGRRLTGSAHRARPTTRPRPAR